MGIMGLFLPLDPAVKGQVVSAVADPLTASVPFYNRRQLVDTWQTVCVPPFFVHVFSDGYFQFPSRAFPIEGTA